MNFQSREETLVRQNISQTLKCRICILVLTLIATMQLGVAYVVASVIISSKAIKSCDSFNNLFYVGWYMIVLGAFCFLGGFVSAVTQRIKPKIVFIFTLYVVPIIAILNVVALIWAAISFHNFSSERNEFKDKLPTVFQQGKNQIQLHWRTNSNAESLTYRTCWMSIEQAGECCGFDGPNDWLKLNGSMTTTCTCSGQRESGCGSVYVQQWKKTVLVRVDGCAEKLFGKLETKLIVFVAITTVGLFIFILIFLTNYFLYQRLKEIITSDSARGLF